MLCYFPIITRFKKATNGRRFDFQSSIQAIFRVRFNQFTSVLLSGCLWLCQKGRREWKEWHESTLLGSHFIIHLSWSWGHFCSKWKCWKCWKGSKSKSIWWGWAFTKSSKDTPFANAKGTGESCIVWYQLQYFITIVFFIFQLASHKLLYKQMEWNSWANWTRGPD